MPDRWPSLHDAMGPLVQELQALKAASSKKGWAPSTTQLEMAVASATARVPPRSFSPADTTALAASPPASSSSESTAPRPGIRSRVVLDSSDDEGAAGVARKSAGPAGDNGDAGGGSRTLAQHTAPSPHDTSANRNSTPPPPTDASHTSPRRSRREEARRADERRIRHQQHVRETAPAQVAVTSPLRLARVTPKRKPKGEAGRGHGKSSSAHKLTPPSAFSGRVVKRMGHRAVMDSDDDDDDDDDSEVDNGVMCNDNRHRRAPVAASSSSQGGDGGSATTVVDSDGDLDMAVDERRGYADSDSDFEEPLRIQAQLSALRKARSSVSPSTLSRHEESIGSRSAVDTGSSSRKRPRPQEGSSHRPLSKQRTENEGDRDLGGVAQRLQFAADEWSPVRSTGSNEDAVVAASASHRALALEPAVEQQLAMLSFLPRQLRSALFPFQVGTS